MKTLVIDGKEYVKATAIAEDLGYTKDYVGQLCRAKKVDAKMVGRSWYVNPLTISGHKGERYRSNKSVTHRDLRQTLQPGYTGARLGGYQTGHRSVVQASFRYESDTSELLPFVKKHHEKTENSRLTSATADTAPIPALEQSLSQENKSQVIIRKLTNKVPVRALDAVEPLTVSVLSSAALHVFEPAFKGSTLFPDNVSFHPQRATQHGVSSVWVWTMPVVAIFTAVVIGATLLGLEMELAVVAPEQTTTSVQFSADTVYKILALKI